MRPDILNPLFRPVTSLAGIGPKLAVALRRLLDRLGERRAAARRRSPLPSAGRHHRPEPPAGHRALAAKARSSRCTCASTATRSRRRGNRRIPYRVFAHDDTGEIALTFFHAHGDWLEKTLPVGADAAMSAAAWSGSTAGRRMVHPDHIVSEDDFAALPLIEPVYPMTAGLARKTLARAIGEAVGERPAAARVARSGAAAAPGLVRLRGGARQGPSSGDAGRPRAVEPAPLPPRL